MQLLRSILERVLRDILSDGRLLRQLLEGLAGGLIPRAALNALTKNGPGRPAAFSVGGPPSQADERPLKASASIPNPTSHEARPRQGRRSPVAEKGSRRGADGPPTSVPEERRRSRTPRPARWSDLQEGGPSGEGAPPPWRVREGASADGAAPAGGGRRTSPPPRTSGDDADGETGDDEFVKIARRRRPRSPWLCVLATGRPR